MIEVGLWKYLAADPTIKGIVGGKIYRDEVLPKGYDLPAIVFFDTHSDSIESLDGDSPTETMRFQFQCFARSSDQATALRRAVRSLLVPKSDGSGTTPTVNYTLPDGTFVQSARMHLQGSLPVEEGIGEIVRHKFIEIEFTFETS